MILGGIGIITALIAAVYGLSMLIDQGVYTLLAVLVETFFKIIEVTSQNDFMGSEIGYIFQRVMVLSGVVALFMLAVSLINYAVNPDKLNDLSKNGVNYIRNILIAVILLIMAPTVFNYSGKIATAIIESDAISNIIYGVDNPEALRINNSDNINKNETISRALANRMYSLFLHPNEGTCDSNGSAAGCKEFQKLLSGEINPSILNTLIQMFGSGGSVTYIPVISWIAGLVLVYYFFRYCLELAVRFLKLLVLQIISPIPIIMSIMPKENKRLGTFFTTYFNIWFQAFIRLITVYLAYAVACMVLSSFDNAGFLVKVILVIGIFQGASQIPKLIDDIIGTKLAADTKGKGFGAVLGSIIGGSVGAFGGAVAGGFAGAAAGGGFGKVATGIASGAASGMWNGTKAGNAKNAVAGMGQITSSIVGSYGTAGNVAAAGFGGFVTGKFDSMTGYSSRADKRLEGASNEVNLHKNFEEAVFKQYAKSNNVGSIDDLVNNDSQLLTLQEERRKLLESNRSSSGFNEIRASELRTAMEQAENSANLYNMNPNKEIPELTRLNSEARNARQAYEDYMATQNNTINQEAYEKNLSDLTNAINTRRKEAKDFYEKEAFASLGNLDTKQIAEKYKNPEEIAKLTDVEKAYYQLTRGKKDIDLYDVNGKVERSKFKDSKKRAEEAEKVAKAEKESDRYRNANTFKGK